VSPSRLTLALLPGRLAVCRLEPGAPFPSWATGRVASVTRTPDEMSVVCSEDAVPPEVRAERGFRCLTVGGPIDFSLTGVLSALARPLATAGISILVISTFDTDLLLVREALLTAAATALREAGHAITGLP
jgi:hypothetical protein